MQSVRSITRGLEILRLLNIRDGLTLTQLVKASGLARGTVYRMLYTLQHLGYVNREEDGRHFLTPKVMSLSHGYDEDNWPTDVAKPLMLKLGEQVNWPVVLTTLLGTTVIVRENTDKETSLVFRVLKAGLRLPILGSASGWIFLAYATPQEREAILALIDSSPDKEYRNVLKNRDRLFPMLDQIAVQGYHANPRKAIKQTVISVPILTSERHALAALSIRYFTTAMPQEEAIELYVEDMKDTADQIASAYNDRVSGSHEPNRIAG